MKASVRVFGLVLALLPLWLLLAVAAIPIHSQLPVARVVLAEVANRSLASVFEGTLRTERISHLSFSSLKLEEVSLHAANNDTHIVRISGVEVELDLPRLVWELIAPGDRRELHFEGLYLENLSLHVREQPTNDDQLELDIQRALTPRASEARRSGSEEKPKIPTTVSLPRIRIDSVDTLVTIRGQTATARLADIRSRVFVDDAGVDVSVRQFKLADGQLHSYSGLGELNGSGRLRLRPDGSLRHSFAGALGGAPFVTNLRYGSRGIKASLNAPEIAPEYVQRWVPQWPLTSPVAARLHIKGPVEALRFETQLELDEAYGEIHGVARGVSPQDVRAQLSLRHINLQSFGANLPQTNINLDTSFRGVSRMDDFELESHGRIQATKLWGTQVPEIAFDLSRSHGTWSASIDAQEPATRFVAKLSGTPSEASFDLQLPMLRLTNNPRLPQALQGRGSASLRGKVEQGELTAATVVVLDRLGLPGGRARNVWLSADIRGPLAQAKQIEIDGQLRATAIEAPPFSFTRLTGQISGSPDSLRTRLELQGSGGHRVRARATVGLDGKLKDGDLHVEKGKVSLDARVAEIDPSVPRIEVPSVRVSGAGEPLSASLRWRPKLLELHADGDDLRLPLLLDALGVKAPLQGSVRVRADVSIDSEQQRGNVRLEAKNVSVGNWLRSKLSANLSLQDRSVSIELQGKDALGFEISAGGSGLLGGDALDAKSWERATGEVQLAVRGVELSPWELVFRELGLERVEGQLGARIVAGRTKADAPLNAFFEVGAQKTKATYTRAKEQLGPFVVHMGGTFDGKSQQVNASGTVSDAVGNLVEATVVTTVNSQLLVNDPTAAMRELQHSDINLVANLPDRRLADIPLTSGLGVAGKVNAQGVLYGTWVAPELNVQAFLSDVQVVEHPFATPLIANLKGSYSGAAGDIDVLLTAFTEGHSVMLGRLQGKLPNSNSPGQATSATATLGFNRLPLEFLPQGSVANLHGRATGRVELELGEESKAVVDLNLDELVMGQTLMGSGVLVATRRGKDIVGQLSLTQADRRLDARVSVQMGSAAWASPPQSVSLGVNAKALDLSALEPLLREDLPRLNGVLDGNFALLSTAAAPGSNDTQTGVWRHELSGDATLKGASTYLRSLDLPVEGLSASLHAFPAGDKTRIEVKELSARARSRRPNITGEASIFVNPTGDIVGGNGNLTLRNVPANLDGRKLGSASGQASYVAERRHGYPLRGRHRGKSYLGLDVVLQELVLRADTSVSRDVLPTDSHPDVRVLQEKPPPKSAPRRTPLRVNVRLDDVRGQLLDLQVPLGGSIEVNYGDSARVEGTLQLKSGGRIPLFGAVLEVQSGTLSLNPDELDNPRLNILLRGRTRDGSLVYPKISGTLREPFIDPSPEQLQKVLGGGAATALSGGLQALGISQLLRGAVELRLDTHEAENDASEGSTSLAAAIQLNDNLWFEGRLGGPEDTSLQQDSTVLKGTLDYRFDRNWSLRTEIGNTGGSMDLLWQHRY